MTSCRDSSTPDSIGPSKDNDCSTFRRPEASLSAFESPTQICLDAFQSPLRGGRQILWREGGREDLDGRSTREGDVPRIGYIDSSRKALERVATSVALVLEDPESDNFGYRAALERERN